RRGDPRLRRHRRCRAPLRRRAPIRHAQAGGACARAGRGAAAPAPRRARRRAEPRGGLGARRVHHAVARRLRPDRPPRRAPHGARDGHRGAHPRARLRPPDRRRNAGRGAAQPGRDRGVPGRRDHGGVTLLELRSVDARYGEVRVLHGVSFAVDDGDFVAILGANGAGKTTTLRAISGTVKTTGDVLFEGSKLFRRTPEGMARRGVAHVPEGRGTFATLSVLDNLRLGAWTQRGTSQRDLAHVFEFFPVLYERREQQAGTLSGGQQQMLALGRAMMAKPRLLLLDEPSLGLAP